MKKTIRVLLGVIMSAFFLWLAVRNANFSQVIATVKKADVRLIFASFFLSVIGLMLRSYRWKLLGKDYAGVPWHFFFRATSIGLMLNMFLPFRSGDLFQGYILSRKSSLPQSYTLATVFLERLVDFFPPAMMLLVGSFFIALPSQIRLNRVAAIIFGIALFLYVLIRYHVIIIDALGRYIKASHSEKMKSLLRNISSAMVFLKDKQVLKQAFPLTLILWLLYTLSTFLVVQSLGIRISFWSAFVIQGITVMSVAIPSSPGFIGTWEFFCILALSIFNIDQNRALSYGLLSHFMAFLPTTSFGLIFLLGEFLARKGRGTAAVEQPL